MDRDAPIPWYIWLSVAGVTSAIIGAHWDISWHRSIGRDTFWTPAHIAIQLCGVIAGITCGYLILWTTFGRSQLREASVNVLGFRGPLGAFICAWGGFTMISSAPFDNWWHNAYGLDVKILSPPHFAGAIGIFAVELGALVLIASLMNKAGDKRRSHLEWLFLYMGGMILVAVMTVVIELVNRVYLHSPVCYRAICILMPAVLAAASRATGYRWAATTVSAVYSLFLLGQLWILPLFPAVPKLGPVMHPVTHFVPNEFPILVVVPAFVLDLLWPRMAHWNKWNRALVSGFLFFVVMVAVEWPFGDFLQSPAARNAVFGSMYQSYFQSPQSLGSTYRFVPPVTAPEFRLGMEMALGFSIVSMWIGMGTGDWLRRVRR
jgi:hypothetical protein